MIAQVLGGFGTSLMIEKFGRKVLLIIGNIICLFAITGTVMVIQFSLSPVIACLTISMFMFGFGLAAGPITWLYLSDILPDNGVALCVTHVWIWTSLNGYFFPKFLNLIGIIETFLIFIVFSITGIFFILCFVKETKGKT